VWELLLVPLALWATTLILAWPEDEPPPDPATEKIVLLPDADGNVGEVVIRTDAGEQTLSTAYGAVQVRASGNLENVQESEASVREAFGEVLDATPPEPVSLVVYFETGSSDTLTPASMQTVAELRALLTERPAPEILVVGHTDTVGDGDDNDALSQARAQAVVDIIRNTGVAAKTLEASGRGERELLIPTADKVDEPRNRRVEINIR
jgi:outer membrane protein OmpA-like peptidoglycan-associated protein